MKVQTVKIMFRSLVSFFVLCVCAIPIVLMADDDEPGMCDNDECHKISEDLGDITTNPDPVEVSPCDTTISFTATAKITCKIDTSWFADEEASLQTPVNEPIISFEDEDPDEVEVTFTGTCPEGKSLTSGSVYIPIVYGDGCGSGSCPVGGWGVGP